MEGGVAGQVALKAGGGRTNADATPRLMPAPRPRANSSLPNHHSKPTANSPQQRPLNRRFQKTEYLITLRDPSERSRQLDQAVTPGPTKYTDSHDYLWSTPARLYAVLDGTLKAWESMQAAAVDRMGAGGEGAAGVPRKVRAMRELRDEIRRKYL